jgi:hypothetical protein
MINYWLTFAWNLISFQKLVFIPEWFNYHLSPLINLKNHKPMSQVKFYIWSTPTHFFVVDTWYYYAKMYVQFYSFSIETTEWPF